MPGRSYGGPDPFAVHCPECGVLPDRRCVNSEGEPQHRAHAWRRQLASALTHNGECRGREAADRYRSLFPDVDVTRVTCAPSRSQYRWRTRWSTMYRRWWANEDEAEAAYQAEQACGCTTFGDEATPVIEAIQGQLGPAQENLDVIARVQERQRVRRKRS